MIDWITALMILFLWVPMFFRFMKLTFSKILDFVAKGCIDYSRASSSMFRALIRGWSAGVMTSIVAFFLGIRTEITGSIAILIAFLAVCYFYKTLSNLTFLESVSIFLLSVGAFGIGLLAGGMAVGLAYFYPPLAFPIIATEVLFIWRPWRHVRRIMREGKPEEQKAVESIASEEPKVQVRIHPSGIRVHNTWIDFRDGAGWKTIAGDDSIARKFLSQEWVRSLIGEIEDYDKLDSIGPGERWIKDQELRIGKGWDHENELNFFDIKVKDKGMMIRVYEDNTAIISYRGLDEQKRVEEFKVATVSLNILREGKLEEPEPVEGEVMEPSEGEGERTTVEVTINASGVWVHGERVTAVERTEDGAVYLHYKKGDRAFRVPIKGPSPVEEPEVSDGEKRVGFLAKTPDEVLLLFLSNLKAERTKMSGGEKDNGVWLAYRHRKKWWTLFGDAEDAGKFFDQSWTKPFIDGIDKYDKVDKIGIGEKEVRGVKVRVEKGEQAGMACFDVNIPVSGVTIRIFDNSRVIFALSGVEKLELGKLQWAVMERAKMVPSDYDGELIPSDMSEVKTMGEIAKALSSAKRVLVNPDETQSTKIEELRKAVEIFDRKIEEYGDANTRCEYVIALEKLYKHTLVDLGDREEAERILEKAMKVMDDAKDKDIKDLKWYDCCEMILNDKFQLTLNSMRYGEASKILLDRRELLEKFRERIVAERGEKAYLLDLTSLENDTGRLAFLTVSFEDSRHHFTNALDASVKAGEDKLSAAARSDLAKVELVLADDLESLTHAIEGEVAGWTLWRAIKFFEKVKNRDGEARARYYAALSLLSQGKYDEAMKQAERAYKMALELPEFTRAIKASGLAYVKFTKNLTKLRANSKIAKEIATLSNYSTDIMKKMGHATFYIAILVSYFVGHKYEQMTFDELLSSLAKNSVILEKAGIKVFAWVLNTAEKALREEGTITEPLLRRLAKLLAVM